MVVGLVLCCEGHAGVFVFRGVSESLGKVRASVESARRRRRTEPNR